MTVSESHDNEAVKAAQMRRENTERVTLASLRSQFTSSSTSSLDEALGTQARFRQEERLRADLRRERRLRQQAITERVNAMQDAMAKDLATQHEMTLDALEHELRGNMEEELEQMQRDALAMEESRMRQELDLRLHRQQYHRRAGPRQLRLRLSAGWQHSERQCRRRAL